MMERISATLETDLLRQFDRFLNARAYTNRSEALRDLIRAALVQEEWRKGADVVAVATLVYDHHNTGLQRRLIAIQHDNHDIIISTTHVHLNRDRCLEALILRGPSPKIKKLGDRLIALKGVLNGKISATGLPSRKHPNK